MRTGHGRMHHNDAFLALLRRSLALCALTFLSACSDGGGDDDDDGGGGGDDDMDASGIWDGTDRRDGGSSATTIVIISESGAFGSASVHQTLSGNGSIDVDELSATATGFALPGQPFGNGSQVASFALEGIVSILEITATYAGGNSSGTLDLDYDSAASGIGASNSLVNGVYTTNIGDTLTVTDGDLSFVSGPDPACTGSGTITFENGGKNVYDWDITLSGCAIVNGAASGVAMVTDSSTGTNDALYMLGQVGNFPWVMLVTK